MVTALNIAMRVFGFLLLVYTAFATAAPLPISVLFASQADEVFRISPSGEKVAFLRRGESGSRLCVGNSKDLPSTMAELSGAKAGDVFSFLWLSGEKIVFAARQQGQRGSAIWVATCSASLPWQTRLLADSKENLALDGIVFTDNENRPEVLLATRSTAYSDLYAADPDTGHRRLLHRNIDSLPVLMTNRSGRALAGIRCPPEGGGELLALISGSMRPVMRSAPGESMDLLSMGGEGTTAYVMTNHGCEFSRIHRIDLPTGKTTILDAASGITVDAGEPLFDRDGAELLGIRYFDDRASYRWHCKDMAQHFSAVSALLRSGDLAVRDVSADRKKWIVSSITDTQPEMEFFYDTENRQLLQLSAPSTSLPMKDVGRMRPVQYQARDGKLIPGYLTLPPGVNEHSLPVVVFPHGGPNKRNFWGFDPRVQFFASRGYAVFQPNFRGSTGYGKAFQTAGDRQWGTGVMQHDITDGVQWLIDSGIADPKRIAIVGGSYGGFAALAGVTFTPELYAAGVCLFGASDLCAFIREIGQTWKPFEGDLKLRIGDPDSPEGAKQLASQSPLHFVERIKVPILVYHGTKDAVVQFGQSEHFVSACRNAGVQVECLVSPEGGHGFTDPLDEQAVYVAIERFLAAHIGGDSQSNAGAEVEKRIKDLRR